MHIGQAKATTLIEVSQTFVINTQQAQHSGVEIVDVDATAGQ